MDISYAVIHNEVQVSPHWFQNLLLASWLHHFQPQMEEQWKLPESPAPKKDKLVRSAGKLMASIASLECHTITVIS